MSIRRYFLILMSLPFSRYIFHVNMDPTKRATDSKKINNDDTIVE